MLKTDVNSNDEPKKDIRANAEQELRQYFDEQNSQMKT